MLSKIYQLNFNSNNSLFIKREDLIPYSFGGNKVRKAILFFNEIDKKDYNYIVTYGSSHSNHCRVVANMAAERNIKCLIIGPKEASENTFNKTLIEICGAEYRFVPILGVHDYINSSVINLKNNGYKPYFIPGGGHGIIGTQAYVDCYKEIKEYEKLNRIKFDYIFFASGTGTTHAGLVCGSIIENDDINIIGISIARGYDYGTKIIFDSILEYTKYKDIKISRDIISKKILFETQYVGDGYGKSLNEIDNIIKLVFLTNGIPLDSTYTGKAFFGMMDYIKRYKIENKNILFIHTGGTPLFFDDIRRFK